MPFVETYNDGGRVRVRPMPGSGDPSMNVQFPKGLRTSAGLVFEVDTLLLSTSRTHYVVRGTCRQVPAALEQGTFAAWTTVPGHQVAARGQAPTYVGGVATCKATRCRRLSSATTGFCQLHNEVVLVEYMCETPNCREVYRKGDFDLVENGVDRTWTMSESGRSDGVQCPQHRIGRGSLIRPCMAPGCRSTVAVGAERSAGWVAPPRRRRNDWYCPGHATMVEPVNPLLNVPEPAAEPEMFDGDILRDSIEARRASNVPPEMRDLRRVHDRFANLLDWPDGEEEGP